jgi:hypothetical protein
MESFQRLLTVLLILFSSVKAVPEPLMVYAVNYGGSAMTDTYGVQYKEYKNCPNIDKLGSLYTNVPKADQTLYDRYCSGINLNFQIPLSGSGKYLMILKFIPFASNPAYAVDISLNKKHQIWTNKNTYNIVGDSGVIAYDEYVVFSVCGDEIQYKDTYSTIVNSKIDLNITSVNTKIIIARFQHWFYSKTIFTISKYSPLQKISIQMTLFIRLNMNVEPTNSTEKRRQQQSITFVHVITKM